MRFAPIRRGARTLRGSSLLPTALLFLFALQACSDASGPSTPSTPATLVVVEGHGEQAPAGTVLPRGPTARVVDEMGNGVPDVEVTFQVVAGGGTAVDATVTTNAEGEARSTWILGGEPGLSQRLEVSAADLSETLEAQAVQAQPGESYTGRRDYIEYLAGSLPLVITAPHGGYLQPPEITDRTWGVTVTDLNTRELALAIRAAIHDRVGAYPHLVICRLDREKLDANREIVEAAQGHWAAERAWWEYHTFADEAGERIEEAFGRGLYLDIHGHGHPIDRIELGYLFSSNELAMNDDDLSTPAMVEKSSIGALVQWSGKDLAALIRGPQGLGTLLAERGFPSVPSATEPDPAGAPYFSGGYSTWRHGSTNGGQISGIQLEHNYSGIRDGADHREAYGAALARALELYFPAHFGFELAPSAATTSAHSPTGLPSG